MTWTGARTIRGTHARLEQRGQQVVPVTEHVVKFVLSGSERPDEYRHPFFVAVAAIPEEAERVALTVYLRAKQCPHVFRPAAQFGLTTCRECGVHLRVRESQTEPSRPRWRGWLRGRRSA